jgi:hypothetical protein
MSFGIPVRNGLGVGLLASTTLSTRNRAPFSPASLFATGEQGAWYDPSDLTTLFQDSAGTTPVTAAAQQVGLMLDKSQGAPATGPELVTNGDFTTNITGWTNSSPGTGNISWDNGSLLVERVSGGVSAYQAVACVIGSTYQVGYSFSPVAGGTIRIAATNATTVPGTGIPTANAGTFVFVATAGTMYIHLSLNTGNGTSGRYDNISVKLLPGNHAFQSNSAQRPTLGRNPFTGTRNLLTYSEDFSNAVWAATTATKTSGVLDPLGGTTATTITATAGNGQILQTVGGSAGTSQAYVTSIWLRRRTGTGSVFLFNPNGGGLATVTLTGSWAQYSVTGLGAAASNFVGIRLATSGDAVDVAFAQFETGSTATAYQRVVTAFDVTQAGVQSLSYLSFDGSNDSMATGTITPGIDKAQVFAGVQKLAEAASGTLIETSTDWVSNNGTLTIAAPSSTGANSYRYGSRGTSGATAGTGVFAAAPNTSVLTGISDIAGDVCRLNRNGVLVEASTADQGTGNYLAYPLYIGRRAGATLPYNGRIYSLILRFGANLSASTILQTETWVGDKTGINIPLSVSPTIYDRFNDLVLDRAGQTIEVR